MCKADGKRSAAPSTGVWARARLGKAVGAPRWVRSHRRVCGASPGEASALQPDGEEPCTSFIPEAQAVLDLVDQCPEQVQKGRFPVIVIEGLDATGKTTVTQSVSDSLKAVLLKSPPSCISQWRKIFDDEPTIIRRAFYSLGNYIVASEIAKESTKSPVIVDRYWHSTATYAIATEVSGGLQHLPPVHHPIYQWPRDLLKPDLVLLLTVSPEERMQRIEGRGMEKTREEAELEADSIFRQKVEVCYQRMENPGCHVVDASPSREKALGELGDYLKFLPVLRQIESVNYFRGMAQEDISSEKFKALSDTVLLTS